MIACTKIQKALLIEKFKLWLNTELYVDGSYLLYVF